MNFACPPFATDCEGAILFRILTEGRIFDKRYILWYVKKQVHPSPQTYVKPMFLT